MLRITTRHYLIAPKQNLRLAPYRQFAEKPPKSVDYPIPSEFQHFNQHGFTLKKFCYEKDASSYSHRRDCKDDPPCPRFYRFSDVPVLSLLVRIVTIHQEDHPSAGSKDFCMNSLLNGVNYTL